MSRCNSKTRIMSSKDAPVGGPAGLNRQPHSEQPNPRKRSCSIHTSSRLMATFVAAPQRCLTACLATSCRQGTKLSGSPQRERFPSHKKDGLILRQEHKSAALNDGYEECTGIEIAPLLGHGNGNHGRVPPQESFRNDCCNLDYFLSVSVTRTANHPSAARIIRVNS